MAAPPGQDRLGTMLEFLAPGLLHGLGNALFAVQGHAQLLGLSGRDPVRERRAILEATGRGTGMIQVVRTLLGEDGAPPQQGGVLLQGLADLLRVALRDRALRLAVRHGSRETPRRVEGTAFSRAIVTVVQLLVEALPASFQGEVYLDLCSQSKGRLEVLAGVCEQADFLPFPVDVVPMARLLQENFSGAGVRVRPSKYVLPLENTLGNLGKIGKYLRGLGIFPIFAKVPLLRTRLVSFEGSGSRTVVSKFDERFEVVYSSEGTVVYPSEYFYAGEYLDDLMRAGISDFLIDLRGVPVEEVPAIVDNILRGGEIPGTSTFNLSRKNF